MIIIRCVHFKESLKQEYLEKVPKIIKRFSDYLGTKQWLVGENVELF